MIKVVDPTVVFEYFLNDPTTPELVKKASIPKIEEIKPEIEIIGFREGPFAQQDAIRLQAANVYYSIVHTLNWINKIQPLKKWAFANKLKIVPRAGRQLNAFYDRFALSFFYDTHPITNKIVFTADSAEAVCHEFGHAVLDAFRPDLYDLSNFECFAFHEAFGDIISMLSSLYHTEIIDYVLRETNNDLTKSNVVSRMSEEFGNAIHHKEPTKGRPSNCLRDATIAYNYINPDSLPSNGSYNNLCREAHNFSRIYSSAWYSILVEIYEKISEDTNNVEALIRSRDVMAKLSLGSLKRIEKSLTIFKSAAHATLLTSQEMGGDYHGLIKKIFIKRQILEPNILY